MFALAFSTYLISLGIARAIGAEPFVVLHGADTEWKVAARRMSGETLKAGVLIGTLIGGSVAFLPSPMRISFLVLAVSLPGLLLQDLWRFIFLATRNETKAFLNDLLWLVGMLSALALFWPLRGPDVIIAVWAGCGVLAAASALLQSRILPGWDWVGGKESGLRGLRGRFLGEFLTSSGATQLAFYGIALVSSVREAGVLRAAQLVLGPLNILFMGISAVAVAEGRQLRKNGSDLLRFAMSISGVLASLALAWTLLLFYDFGGIGTRVIGDIWSLVLPVVLPQGLALVASGAMSGAFLGLRSMAAASSTLRVRLVTVPLLVGGPVAGAAVGGAIGAAWGFAVAGGFAVGPWWKVFLDRRREDSRKRD